MGHPKVANQRKIITEQHIKSAKYKIKNSFFLSHPPPKTKDKKMIMLKMRKAASGVI